ncbi:helix-turn-helix domain-containing protein [Streptomyces noursei]|uniref:helix-turn-helix domain-containing protein n=1 Tax=Streptomyces noursei TaxID=1971 RepID=UPI000C99BBF4|nr:helix-turn-helix domain-containing protein [Streptomyces noursei]
MSDEQQHSPDEEQQPGWTPGEIHRATKKSKARRLEPTPAAQRLGEQLFGILAEFEQARRAEIIAAGGNPDDDRDRLEYVRLIAEQYQHHHRNAAELPVLIQSLADDLDLEDVRALRVAGEAAVAITPEVIMRAADSGMKAPEIAGEIGLTPSRVYDLIRKERQKRDAIAQHEARRAAIPTGDTQFTWRLDLFDSPAGKGWQVWEEGEDQFAEGSEARLAEHIVRSAGASATQCKARVLIWQGPEAADDEALYQHVFEPGQK